MKTFTNIKAGDIVVACDEYSHDYNEHIVKINSVEYDEEYATKTNPRGMVCYGTDLEEESCGDDYISFVHEGNFIGIAENVVIKAVNIEWDVDRKKDLEDLPKEIEIPSEIDEEEVADYLSDVTGFCHKGFSLVCYRK